MSRRSGLDIKRQILFVLKSKKECSLRELESKVDTNYRSILKHCEELEYFGLIQLKSHKISGANGRPFTTVFMTPEGRQFQARAQ